MSPYGGLVRVMGMMSASSWRRPATASRQWTVFSGSTFGPLLLLGGLPGHGLAEVILDAFRRRTQGGRYILPGCPLNVGDGRPAQVVKGPAFKLRDCGLKPLAQPLLVIHRRQQFRLRRGHSGLAS